MGLGNSLFKRDQRADRLSESARQSNGGPWYGAALPASDVFSVSLDTAVKGGSWHPSPTIKAR